MTNLRSLVLVLLASAALSAGCAGDDAAVEVADVDLTEDDLQNANRRQRLAAAATKIVGRMPNEPIRSDHPLDVAVGDSLQMTRAVWADLTEAELMSRAEIRGALTGFVRTVAEDAGYVAELADTATQEGPGPVAVSRSCTFVCLEEWQQCLDNADIDDPYDPRDWGNSALCAVALELCWADCLLPG